MYKKFNSKEEVVEFLSKVDSLKFVDGKFYNKNHELRPWEHKPPAYTPKKRDKHWYISRDTFTDIGNISTRLTDDEVNRLFVKARGFSWSPDHNHLV